MQKYLCVLLPMMISVAACADEPPNYWTLGVERQNNGDGVGLYFDFEQPLRAREEERDSLWSAYGRASRSSRREAGSSHAQSWLQAGVGYAFGNSGAVRQELYGGIEYYDRDRVDASTFISAGFMLGVKFRYRLQNQSEISAWLEGGDASILVGLSAGVRRNVTLSCCKSVCDSISRAREA